MNDETKFARSEALSGFGAAVRRIRLERGLSQEQFADLCQLDRTYIGGVERGERNVGLINVYRIASALEVAASSLLDVAESFDK